MELILLKDVASVGRKGDVVRVSDGYARNFLFPRKLALPSTRNNREFVEEQRIRSAQRKTREKEAAKKKADQMSEIKIVIKAKAGEQGKLYGSVTAEDIAENLRSRNFNLDKKQVHLKDPIRALGMHSVTVEVHPEVRAVMSVEVIAES